MRRRRSVDETSRRGMWTRTQRQPGRRDRGRDVLPIDDRERHRGLQGVRPVPGVERGRDIAPDDQEQLTLGLGQERLDRVDRVGRARPIDLDPATQRVGRRRRSRPRPSRTGPRRARRPGPASARDRRPRRRAPGRGRAGRARPSRPRDARCGRGRRCRRGGRGAPPGECTRRPCERRVADRLSRRARAS